MTKYYYTYVLYSNKFERLYIGQTDNIQRRYEQHQKGKVESTKPYLPYKIIHIETFGTRVESVNREKELKKTKGRKFLKSLIS